MHCQHLKIHEIIHANYFHEDPRYIKPNCSQVTIVPLLRLRLFLKFLISKSCAGEKKKKKRKKVAVTIVFFFFQIAFLICCSTFTQYCLCTAFTTPLFIFFNTKECKEHSCKILPIWIPTLAYSLHCSMPAYKSLNAFQWGLAACHSSSKPCSSAPVNVPSLKPSSGWNNPCVTETQNLIHWKVESTRLQQWRFIMSVHK